MIVLNEMALSRSDAISLCMGLGKQFIIHYKNVSGNDPAIIHHMQEMQTWWNKVKDISLKPKSKKITDINLVDWFFTAGGDVEDYLDEDLIDEYNNFVVRILNNKNEKLINLLNK